MANYHEESFGGAKNHKKASNPPDHEPHIIPVSPKSFGIGAFLEKLQPQPARINEPAKINEHSSSVNPPVIPLVNSRSAHNKPKSSVVFAKTGQEIACDGQESILEIGEQAGIKMRSGCRAGSCGACKKLKLEGSVQMAGFDPEALTPTEQQAGYILTCMAFPVGKVVVDI